MIRKISEEVEGAVLEQMAKHPLTDKGIAQFLADAKKIPARK